MPESQRLEEGINASNKEKKANTKQNLPENHCIDWLQCLELSYDTGMVIAPTLIKIPNDNSCFQCGESDKPLSKCSKCNIAKYCSRECQIKNWKLGSTQCSNIPHRYLCKAYTSFGPSLELETVAEKELARNALWTRIRFYSCPYSIHHSQTLGRGFCFVQSPFTLNQIALPFQVYSKLYCENVTDELQNGIMKEPRNVIIHYLTLGEYDSELCKDDFELASVRPTLTTLVNEYDRKKELVIMMRFRCGHVSVGIVRVLVPDYPICISLGRDYYGSNGTTDSTGTNHGGGVQALQLNLDDL